MRKKRRSFWEWLGDLLDALADKFDSTGSYSPDSGHHSSHHGGHDSGSHH